MAPHNGLVHLKEYDIKDSNIELIGSDLDHKVKYASAATEPAWNDGRVGVTPGLFVWRIEDFSVVPVPPSAHGQFYSGDSYIILSSQALSPKTDPTKLTHAIHFLLGAHTTQDEAGTAAYKTVELDAFLRGAAVQHRELQARPSPSFLALFPRLTFLRGGVASGFRHVVETSPPTTTPEDEVTTLLRVFKHPSSSSAAAPAPNDGGVIVCEVEPTWRSLDEGDVFILERGAKIWVWQGGRCSPMERAKAAQVVHEMRLAKRGDVEVVAQGEAGGRAVVRMLGGGGAESESGVLRAERPVVGAQGVGRETEGRRLFRLSDESGRLEFGLVRDVGEGISMRDLDGDDVFVLDDAGKTIWVWEGQGASKAEKAMWLKVAQAYVRKVQGEDESGEAYLTPIAKVREGCESAAFLRAIEVA
ncbi:hypothetical protein NEMBOFW57_004259 [Staphylotrichum longicolle]|uniref:Gelsolin-like domain-containing protein n=1 Tax=Staphylotrichum longicolle TaxID=669026 RepID=A0AAD4F7L7_9PEZI|nr:hypothetical protein NEMBOFW57_004259 [Staphylotrichum longicolle]